MLKFSFSLPVYNEEARLEKCLNSILSQNYPKENIEILVVDGGSSDKTKDIASRFECVRLFDNPKKLADFGAKISAVNATGDLFVIFAADNELAGKNWLQMAAGVFMKEPGLDALWGKIISSKADTPINKYYSLIQNDPLSFFINKNLQSYLKRTKAKSIDGAQVYLFDVFADKPLIWGANGLVYKTSVIKDIILQDNFLADNDVFQIMIERGFNKVAYLPDLHIYHHHVKSIKDWVKKWRRNYIFHFLTKIEERNLRWVFVKRFYIKLAVWMVYSVVPIFSLPHSIYLAFRDKSYYWLYHPLMNFIQMATYLTIAILTKAGRKFLKELLKS